MIYKFSYYCLIFFIFSFFGYLCEVVSVSIIDKKINLNRGYFIGPYLPIFGFGSLFILLFLDKYKNDYLVLFVLGMVACCILEYVTSYVLEKIFKLRWWDYSNKRFHINGRVSLETGLLFGFGSIFIVWFSNNYLYNLLDKIPHNILIFISMIFLICFIIDFFVSTSIIIGLRRTRLTFDEDDDTEKVRNEMFKELSKHMYLYKRFIDSFPRIRLDDESFAMINKTLEKIRKKGNNE